MSNKHIKPTREGFEKFKKGYVGNLDEDRAYMAAVTGDNRYNLRRDIFPGETVAGVHNDPITRTKMSDYN